MRLVVVLYFVLTPFTIANVFIGGRRVEVSLLLASFIALAFLLDFVRSRIGVGRSDRWSVWFWLFICAAAVSLLASPYLRESYVLGFIQLVGMVAVLLAALYVSKHVVSSRARFTTCVKALVLSVGVVAAIGAWQFVAFNVLNVKFLADFTWVNALMGPSAGEIVWRDPGFIGPIRRANSVITEPSFFAQILGMVGGIALLRTGLMGRAFRKSLSGVVPLWVAVFVLIGFVIAISILGYVLLALTVASLVVVLYRFDLRSLPRVLSAGIAMAVLGGLLVLGLGEAFVNKLRTIPLVLSAVTGGVQTVLPEQYSALPLAANISIALDNLKDSPFLGVGPGGHPPSYDVHVPVWLYTTVPDLLTIHQQDAGSLLVRLLSETGLVGTILFLAGWLVVVLRARSAIQRALTFHRENHSQPSTVLTLAIGITASCAALVTVYLIRMPIYYDPPIWVLIALTAAIPPLLNREHRGASRLQ